MYGLAAVNTPVVGRSFWDFLEDTSGQSAGTLLDKYRVAVGLGAVAVFVAIYVFGGKKQA